MNRHGTWKHKWGGDIGNNKRNCIRCQAKTTMNYHVHVLGFGESHIRVQLLRYVECFNAATLPVLSKDACGDGIARVKILYVPIPAIRSSDPRAS